MSRKTLTFLSAVLLCAGLGAEDKPKGVVKAKQEAKPGKKVGLNPQPEPPGDKKKVLKPGETKGLNPQPEPPKQKPKAQPGMMKPAETKKTPETKAK